MLRSVFCVFSFLSGKALKREENKTQTQVRVTAALFFVFNIHRLNNFYVVG